VFWISDQTLPFTHHSFVNIHSQISAGIDKCRVTRVDPPLLICTTMLLKGDQTGATLCATLNIQNFSIGDVHDQEVAVLSAFQPPQLCWASCVSLELHLILARVKHHTRLRIHDYHTVSGLRNAFLVDLSYHCTLLDAAIVRVAAATWWTRTRIYP
jgi:hypothetical protein